MMLSSAEENKYSLNKRSNVFVKGTLSQKSRELDYTGREKEVNFETI